MPLKIDNRHPVLAHWADFAGISATVGCVIPIGNAPLVKGVTFIMSRPQNDK